MARGENLRRHRWSYGTICGAMDGPGGLSVAAVHSPWGPLIGGTIHSMTVHPSSNGLTIEGIY